MSGEPQRGGWGWRRRGWAGSDAARARHSGKLSAHLRAEKRGPHLPILHSAGREGRFLLAVSLGATGEDWTECGSWERGQG